VNVRDFFASDGPLAEVVGDAYRVRPEQVELAEKITEGLRDGAVVLGDAKTGVGKSFAYLAALGLAEEKAVISTSTLALQDQLLRSDLPTICKALDVAGIDPPSYALIKGRSNFLCQRRFGDFIEGNATIHGDELDELAAWRDRTRTGDKKELNQLPVFWREIASDSQDCVRKTCEYAEECFFFQHRAGSAGAQIIVANHALFTMNLVSGGTVFDDSKRHIIFDEAHQLPATISANAGAEVTEHRIRYCTYVVDRKVVDLKELTDDIRSDAGAFFAGLRTHRELGDPGSAPPVYGSLTKNLGLLVARLESNPSEEVNALAPMVASVLVDLRSFYVSPDPSHAYGVVTPPGGGPMALRSWLVEPSEVFKPSVLNTDKAVVLTSATLAVARSFDFPKARLGIDRSTKRVIEHYGSEVFDYQNNALVYVAEDLPEPVRDQVEEHTAACIKRTEALIAASKGRALVLLATHKALKAFQANLVTSHPTRYQGEASAEQLTLWLQSTPGAVLVATRSFWEGIDVPGDAVSIVIIDKVPFPHPNDPVIQKLTDKAGKRWFMDVSLPHALMTIAQGSGRLIRSHTDRGVIAILDPRVSTKRWGGQVIKVLPAGVRIAKSIAAVEGFFTKGGGKAA
jgi:ATP-dependent DNA helicase DinG